MLSIGFFLLRARRRFRFLDLALFGCRAQLGQKRGDIGCLHQAFLAELDEFQIAATDQSVECRPADREQIECLFDGVCRLEKTERPRIGEGSRLVICALVSVHDHHSFAMVRD
jgi:hypothetical protein